jgi:Isochorismatase family
MSNMHGFLRGAAAAAAVIILTFAAWASAADIIDDWAKVQPPPPPKLKAVTLDGPTTALIFMDMNQIQCAQNPRCAATVPAFKRLYDAGRAAGAMFWYSLSMDAKTPDMIAPGFAPKDGEWEKTPGAHQVTFGSHLLEKLKARNIQTAVICGHSWQAVVVGNALDLALRGYKVVVPVDCNASNMPYVLYLEQYSAWWAYKSEDVANHATLTRSTMIKFRRTGGSGRSAQKAPAGGE